MRLLIRFLWVGGALLVTACRDTSDAYSADLDLELAAAFEKAGVTSIPRPAPEPVALVELGRLLFFDKILSGNKDIACSTCHHVTYHSTDLLSLGIGTGGSRKGPSRRVDRGRFLGRNTADLYNRGLESVGFLFHDGRVSQVGNVLTTPAADKLPPGVPSVLAAQAMFPPIGRDEMRGLPGDTTVRGEPNEVAVIPDHDFPGIWRALTARILAIPEYRARFREAFPAVDSTQLGFEHVATAIAAFEREVFTMLDSPFDRYIRGDLDAISDSAKRGAQLFYGSLRCGSCHSGPLLTDQRFHNIGIPSVDPGPLPDTGRAAVTGNREDRFGFRTPSLRNVLLTGPWMHNGAFTTIEQVLRHYRDAEASLRQYDAAGLDPRIDSLVDRNPQTLDAILATLDPAMKAPVDLRESDMSLVVAFLACLTDPAAVNQLREIPPGVPSGLRVFD